MEGVRIKDVPATIYVSRAKALRADEIDTFVREAIADLRRDHAEAAPPFALYHGCDKDDRQLVQVCLPTASGPDELPAGRVAYTVARGRECDYPAITGAYDAVARYVEAGGLETDGPPRETYLTELDADEPAMEIAFPLA